MILSSDFRSKSPVIILHVFLTSPDFLKLADGKTLQENLCRIYRSGWNEPSLCHQKLAVSKSRVPILSMKPGEKLAVPASCSSMTDEL